MPKVVGDHVEFEIVSIAISTSRAETDKRGEFRAGKTAPQFVVQLLKFVVGH